MKIFFYKLLQDLGDNLLKKSTSEALKLASAAGVH